MELVLNLSAYFLLLMKSMKGLIKMKHAER